MLHLSTYKKFFKRFRADERGAALVEFAIMLPMMLLLFAVVIEGGRLMWSYQAVNAGVRDATRYLARVTSSEICADGGSVAGYTSDLENIVRQTIGGTSIFPTNITVDSVTPSLNCVAGTYRVSPAPVVQITATMTIEFPFSGLFGLNGSSLSTMTKTVADQSRVFGT
ncbi:TadE-like protein [Roseovarius albus]|uniref:TadE-like protein n=1 Tax=Roseovarius albus TaxID=1247867 RepID=A0A1X7A9H7_9RHOB|nr:TadE/TadG family type IV pilus assembly protein [Roseovarius albus]SLN73315.1 TadE-like protein [Roseovarius albus]